MGRRQYSPSIKTEIQKHHVSAVLSVPQTVVKPPSYPDISVGARSYIGVEMRTILSQPSRVCNIGKVKPLKSS